MFHYKAENLFCCSALMRERCSPTWSKIYIVNFHQYHLQYIAQTLYVYLKTFLEYKIYSADTL